MNQSNFQFFLRLGDDISLDHSKGVEESLVSNKGEKKKRKSRCFVDVSCSQPAVISSLLSI